MKFDVNELLAMAVNSDATSAQRMAAKQVLRDNGYGEILSQRIQEHITELKNQVRAMVGDSNFEAINQAVQITLKDSGLTPN